MARASSPQRGPCVAYTGRAGHRTPAPGAARTPSGTPSGTARAHLGHSAAPKPLIYLVRP